MTAATLVRPTVGPRLFTVDDFYAMADAGILGRNDRVELLNGVIIEISPIGSSHAAYVNRFVEEFTIALRERARVSGQGPLQIDEHTQLQPDVCILRWRDDFYEFDVPRPEDVLLLIEVSDTTLEYDRGPKLDAYAEAEIPEVWIAIIPTRCVEVYTDPVDGVYTNLRVVESDGVLTPAAFDDVRIPVSRVIHRG